METRRARESFWIERKTRHNQPNLTSGTRVRMSVKVFSFFLPLNLNACDSQWALLYAISVLCNTAPEEGHEAETLSIKIFTGVGDYCITG